MIMTPSTSFAHTGVHIGFALISTLLLSSLVSGQTEDPCTDFINIGNEKRSLMYRLNVAANEQSLCDTYLNPSAWYSFEERTGSEIPELSTLGPYYCGATSPVYIIARAVETHHAEAKRTELTVQANVRSADGGYSKSIQIKYCKQRSADLGHDTFVYQLVPAGCPLSYCAGNTTACPLGTYYNGILETCVEGLPQMNANPILRGPIISRNETIPGSFEYITVQQFSFYCDVDYTAESTDNGARFKIQLLFDNVLAEDIQIADANATYPSAQIVETVLQYRLGKALKCSVRSYWFGNENPTMSDMRQSNSYWIGIKAVNNPFIIEHTGSMIGELKFESTVPITCWHCYVKHVQSQWDACTAPCIYSFEVGLNPTEGVIADDCWMSINESKNTTMMKVEIAEPYPQPVSSYNCYFPPLVGRQDYNNISNPSQSYVLWDGYSIPNSTIEFRQQQPIKYCDSTGDPHINTIHGRTIHNYLTGTMKLLSTFDNITNSNLQIQTRQVLCNGGVACNCAVVIREWNDAYILDACKDLNSSTANPTNFNVVLTRVLQPSSGPTSSVWLDSTTGKYHFVFNSGLQVEVRTRDYYLGIYVTMPGFYTGYVEGLCTENLNQSLYYRLPEEHLNNLFTHKPQCVYYDMPDIVCKCNTTTGSDQPAQCVPAPYGADTLVVSKTTSEVCNPQMRSGRLTWAPTTVRSTQDSDDYIDPSEVYYSMPYDPNEGANVNPVWPTPSGIQETTATEYCYATLMTSSAYQSCAGMFNVDTVIGNCKLDVQLFDKLVGAETYRSAMEAYCIQTVKVESNVTSKAQMETNPMVTNVTENLCPNACNTRGTCTNATCICSAGYVGPDCSIDANSPVVIRSLYQGGLCNIQDRACEHTNVVVSNVYDAGSLSCRFRRFHLTNSSIQLPTADVKGKLNTMTEVQCPSPADDFSADFNRRQSYGYHLSISSDQVLYSNESVLDVYDTVCLTCQVGATSCQQTSNTCFIDALCHANGVRRNALVDCLACKPQTSISAWTDTTTWTNWTTCSRDCDVGITERSQICATPPSPAMGTEAEFCQVKKCSGNPDERNEGIIITTSLDDVETMLIKEHAFFGEIANAVNSYCTLHSSECCTALGLTPSTSAESSMNVTATDQCFYAAGYPDVWSSPARNKIIVRASTDTVHAQCTGTSSQPSEIYFNGELVLAAVTQSEAAIETAIGITIIDITPS